MSDNKKWFKVWAHILTDMNFQNIRMEDKGRWLTLGALLCQQGENGMIKITPPATLICQMFGCNDMGTLNAYLTPLLKCNVRLALQDDGSLIVSMKNWYKYQRDDSKDRVRKFRNKKHRNVTHQEERRGEVTPTSTSSATRAPLERGRATRENGGEETMDYTDAEMAERNREWKRDTNEPLPESERMTPEEMRAIRLKNFGPLKSESGGKR